MSSAGDAAAFLDAFEPAWIARRGERVDLVRMAAMAYVDAEGELLATLFDLLRIPADFPLDWLDSGAATSRR